MSSQLHAINRSRNRLGTQRFPPQYADRSLTDDEIRSKEAFLGLRPGVDLDENGVRFGKSANGWLQDRGAMARGDSYTGVVGTTAQDCAVQESMGAIQDRTKEHLGASDIAVIRMRRMR